MVIFPPFSEIVKRRLPTINGGAHDTAAAAAAAVVACTQHWPAERALERARDPAARPSSSTLAVPASLTGIILFFSIESRSIFFGRKNGVRWLDTQPHWQGIIGMLFLSLWPTIQHGQYICR